MGVFYLEEALNNVINEKTKFYLKEVVSCYFNNNYRSCIVSMYTTVMYDFLDKLIKMRDIYNSEEAKRLLEEIELMQKDKNTLYSNIESKILEGIQQINLLNPLEIEQVNDLKKARNNAAHSVFKNEYELFNPTKEQTLAHLRNMFDAVFTKDIILSKKILNNFRDDICEYYDRVPNLDEYDIFLENRYFKRLNDETKKYLFKEIWKSTFWFDKDEKCIENRKVLLKTLLLFVKWDDILFLRYFKEHNETLCSKINICSFNIEKAIESSTTSFLCFLSENPEFYKVIPKDKSAEIKAICINCPNGILQADFLYDNAEDYFDAIFNYIKTSKINSPCLDKDVFLNKYKKYKDIIGSKVRIYLNEYYYNNVYSNIYGRDFDYINSIYSNILIHVLDDYSEEELKNLLEKIGDSSTYKDANTNWNFKNQVLKIIENKNYNIASNNYSVLRN
ncbi:hypothetical protein [Lysinibacillus pakistanensis]|uniref:hypothetical protein n=1 Tax=Lysinibacillus pakistanensis TaxID=759811 RepID=UPI003D2D6CBB